MEQRALLGGLDPSVLIALGQADESRAPLSRDAILRISLLLGAYEGLERVFRGTPAESDAWVRRPNAEAPFSGRTPLDFLLDGGLPAMAATRDYLDAWAGGPPVREARPAGGE